MWKFCKMLIGVALLPLCWAASVSVYALFQTSVESSINNSGLEAWALPIGFISWAVIFFLLPRPTRTYVFGHELTHAFWALMMGGRIGKMKVGKDSGYVELSKTNFIITLAPYFFPIYIFILIGAYSICSFYFDVESQRIWWLGGVGFTWAFHLTFTLNMLAQRQPDVQEHGRIFSYTVIYFMNVLLIGIWMVVIGAPTFQDFRHLLSAETAEIYHAANALFKTGWLHAAQWLEGRQP